MTKRTSTSYVCTLDVNSVSDMQMLQVIRKTVRVSNTRMPNKKRVVLRGRKPAEQYFNLRTGRFNSYNWGGDCVGGIANATKLDVYIYDRKD
jgi:hypothetical protein